MSLAFFKETVIPDLPAQRTIPLEFFLAAREQTLESADGFLFRSLRQGGFEVVIGLSKSPGHDTLRRLAACRDRHVALRRAFAQSDPAETEKHPQPSKVGWALGQLCSGWLRYLFPHRRSQKAQIPLALS